MKKRLIGKKTDRENGWIHIETGMNDESFKYEIGVYTDSEGRISDVSGYSVYRCKAIWETGEDWCDYPVKPGDYAENGPAEDLIRNNIKYRMNKRLFFYFHRRQGIMRVYPTMVFDTPDLFVYHYLI